MFNFGQPQQTQQPAFGATNTGFGFGSQQQQPAFGQQQPTTSIFGQPTTTPAFGSSTPAFGGGGFGSAARPAQGMFGAATSTAPAFGSTSAFGAPQQQTTSLFGQPQQQSAFRPQTGMFGQPSTTTPFGSTATSTPFGSSSTATAGAWNQTQDAGSNGTGNPSFRATPEAQEPGQLSRLPQNQMQSITAMPEYVKYSFEELRCRDYELGKKFSTSGGNVFGQGGFGSATTSGFGTATTQSTPFSSFGQKPATGTGFGSTAFGTSQPAPAFGGFGTATSQPSVFGQPAQSTATTSAFGTPSTSTFGGFGSTSTTGGLFGKPATSTAAPAFGNFSATTQPTTSAFGFGTATSTAAPAFGGFGATATTQPSMFGSTQPATTSGFGGFGQTTAFGSKPTTSTPFSGFGQTQTTQPTTGFGTGFGAGFGQQSTGLGTGLGFGTPAATTAATGGLFSGLGGGFGQQTSQPATGFGFAQTTKPQAGFSFAPAASTTPSLFGTQSTFGSTPLFQQSTTFGTSAAPQYPLQASIDKQPYGYNPLFALPPLQPQRPPQQQQQQQQQQTQQDQQSGIIPLSTPKKPALTPMYKLTPRTTSKIKLRGFTPVRSSAGHLFDGTAKDEAVLGFSPTSQFVPRRNIKQLDVDLEEERDGEKGKEKAEGTSLGFTAVNQESKSSKTFDADKEEVVQRLETPSKPPQSIKPINKTPSKPESPKLKTPPKPVTPRIEDYQMTPSIPELADMSDEELRKVKNFTVSLEGVGSIKFLRPVDLLAAAPSGDRKTLHLIPGNVVVIKNKVVEVYPEEVYGDDIPPVGFGLNCPAEIRLYDCWAIDAATREWIKDPNDPRTEKRIQQLKNREGTEFLGFNPTTGEWRFKVKHF